MFLLISMSPTYMPLPCLLSRSPAPPPRIRVDTLKYMFCPMAAVGLTPGASHELHKNICLITNLKIDSPAYSLVEDDRGSHTCEAISFSFDVFPDNHDILEGGSVEAYAFQNLHVTLGGWLRWCGWKHPSCETLLFLYLLGGPRA